MNDRYSCAIGSAKLNKCIILLHIINSQLMSKQCSYSFRQYKKSQTWQKIIITQLLAKGLHEYFCANISECSLGDQIKLEVINVFKIIS